MSEARLAVLDIETDPFEAGRFPLPFAVGIYTDKGYEDWWGDDCIDKAMDYLEKLNEPLLIYAHNGGKFDFSYCVEYIDNPISLIKSRLGKAKLFHHEIRDSYLIMPFALAAYRKTPIDYSKFERHCRQKHRKEILAYLYDDCRDLFTLVAAFVDRFGRVLTIGKAGMTELKKLHDFQHMPERSDVYFRQYYFGGRVQCFRGGHVKGPLKVFDINAEYPHVMRTIQHPINNAWDELSKLPASFAKPYFAKIDVRNRQALPVRTDNGLIFSQEVGTFFACSHEIETALEFGLIDILKVHECFVARQSTTFDLFVDKFYAEREIAKRNKNRINDLFCKYLMNAPAGKFGQNPREYEDCHISFDEADAFALLEAGMYIVERWEKYTIWAKPARVFDSAFFDVSVAASITSAGRAMIMRGLQSAVRPIYCDTDCIICEDFISDDIDPFTLGKWKLELECDNAVIAGKKLYGLYDGPRSRPKFKKIVSKGGTLTGKELLAIADGAKVEYSNPVPTFSWRKEPSFVKRTFRKTA